MTDSVGGLIRAAMRKAGILAAGEALPADEGDDALEVLRDMLDDWSNEALIIPMVSELVLPLQAGQSTYTIGLYPLPKPDPLPENHLEAARPVEIQSAFIRDSLGTDYIQEIMNVDEFARISRKTNGSKPSRFFVKNGWPLITIQFEAEPYASDSLHLYTVHPLSDLIPTLGLSEELALPPGYRQAIIYNLAIMLSPEWGKDITRATASIAADSKKKIKRRNYQPLTLVVDRALSTQRKGLGTYIIEQGP